MPSEPDYPSEAPTMPELPTVRCLACHGRNEPCDWCRGTRLMSRHEVAQFHARSQGRPPSSGT